MMHLLRTEEGDPLETTTVDGLPPGCPPAPLAFSMAMANPEEDFYRSIAEAQVNPKPVFLNRYTDDITLIAAPEAADKCFEALRQALTEAGMLLNEATRTAWTTDGNPPETPRAYALWNQAKGH